MGVYWPGYPVNAKVVELRNVSPDEVRGDLAFAFHRMGFTSVVTRGEGDYFLDRFWRATVTATAELFKNGLPLDEIMAAMAEFGFTIPFGDWAGRFGSAWKTEFSKQRWTRRKAVLVPKANETVPRVYIAHWMALVFETLDKSELAHPSFADVVARDLLGFPLMHQSLTRLATRKWLREHTLGDLRVTEILGAETAQRLRRHLDFAKSSVSNANE
jgi:hypothetical protein